VGGGATKRARYRSIQDHNSPHNVKAVLVNFFGGIVRCDNELPKGINWPQ